MKKTILVVDDEAPLLRALKRSFESKGYAVRTAVSVYEAMTALATKGSDIDLLVTDNDIENPNDGVLLIWILGHFGDPIPGILHSGRTLVHILKDCRKQGIDSTRLRHHVQKPDLETLTATVASLLGD